MDAIRDMVLQDEEIMKRLKSPNYEFKGLVRPKAGSFNLNSQILLELAITTEMKKSKYQHDVVKMWLPKKPTGEIKMTEAISQVFHQVTWDGLSAEKDFIETENSIIDFMASFLRRRINLYSLVHSNDTTKYCAQTQFEKSYTIFGVRANLDSFYVSTLL